MIFHGDMRAIEFRYRHGICWSSPEGRQSMQAKLTFILLAATQFQLCNVLPVRNNSISSPRLSTFRLSFAYPESLD